MTFVDSLFDVNTTFYQRDPDGFTRLYCVLTGKVLAILGSREELQNHPSEVVEITREDGSKVLVQKGLEGNEHALGVRSGTFSKILLDVICSRIANGESLRKMCDEEGMPSYATISRWRREDPEIRMAFERAFEDHADYTANKIIDIAEKAYLDKVDVDQMAAVKHFTENLWKSAAVHKPRQYAPNMKISGDANAPLQLIIDTGIRRKSDPGYTIDETAKLREVYEQSEKTKKSKTEKEEE